MSFVFHNQMRTHQAFGTAREFSPTGFEMVVFGALGKNPIMGRRSDTQKDPDPKLDQAAIQKYWKHDGVAVPGRASEVIDDAAMIAMVDGRSASEKNAAKQAVDHLVTDFPEAAKKAVERLRAPGNDPAVYKEAIQLITHDMQEHGIPVPASTPAQGQGAKAKAKTH
jgi:hypothetical protein